MNDPWTIRPAPTKAEIQREKRAAKKRAWQQELIEIHRKSYRLPGLMEEQRKHLEKGPSEEEILLQQIHEKMLGPEFRAWYEATTGEPADEWLSRVVISHEEFTRRTRDMFARSQLDWTRTMIEVVARKFPWTDPEKRSLWAKEIAECTDARERRMMLMKMATPRWANREAIMEIYRRRAQIEAETGIPHDVDHIVPIVSQVVCGLHCEHNLQIIPASENRSKSNKFEPWQGLDFIG